jgi:GxxExxY protein
VDLKVTDAFTPVQRSQMICYLHVSGKRVGLIINFNVAILKDGIKRVILSR